MNSRFTFLSMAAAIALSAMPLTARANEAEESTFASYPRPEVADDVTRQFRAAHGDFLAGSRRFAPMIEIRAQTATGARARTDGGEVGHSASTFDAMVPMPLSKDSTLIAGVFERSRGYRDARTDDANGDTMFGTGFRVGFGTFVTEDLLVQALWQPAVYSDLDGNVGKDDWYLKNGMALATYRVDDRVYLKGGLAMMQSFEDTSVVPILGASWLFAEDWRLDVLLPRTIEVSYAPAAPWILHGGFEMEAEEYRMRSDALDIAGASTGKAHDHRLFIGGIFRATKSVSISLKAGVIAGGTYEWRDAAGAEAEDKLERGVFGSFGVGWTF